MERVRQGTIATLGVALALFTLSEVNYQFLKPLSQLAVFAMLGLVLCFLNFPLFGKHERGSFYGILDWLLALGAIVCCSYLIVVVDASGRTSGAYTEADVVVAIIGVFLVLEATRRAVGWALPILAMVFLAYAFAGSWLPDWLFPHKGYDLSRVASQTFLRTEGVFGTALFVMFTYVFLFVLFGAFLEASGATGFIVNFAQRVFGRKSGGAAKVSVLGSGLMGSLSGSAVANAVTTGTFTIPMMRSNGFKPHIAGGITAAAASGGALVPPVMGAGAYMMLEIVEPAVTFVEIARAALIPALLYYFSLLLIVHFYARASGAGVEAKTTEETNHRSLSQILFSVECLTFFGALFVLIFLLLMGKSPKLAVSYSLGFILGLILVKSCAAADWKYRIVSLGLIPVLWLSVKGGWSLFGKTISWAHAGIFTMIALLLIGMMHRTWRPTVVTALIKTSKNGIALVAAAACVGIIIGVVTLTGVGTAFPNEIVPLAERSLFLALTAIMVCSIVLGMGLPSAVCYLLMATLIGPVLKDLGIPVLAAHLFIFYFGMMSMVTPPVALAAYASASIAGSGIMKTGLASFRFALVGFTLPFMFVYRPELLLMAGVDGPLYVTDVIMAVAAAIVGIIALAAGIAGYLFAPLRWGKRSMVLVGAALALFPDIEFQFAGISPFDLAGLIILSTVAYLSWRESQRPLPEASPA